MRKVCGLAICLIGLLGLLGLPSLPRVELGSPAEPGGDARSVDLPILAVPAGGMTPDDLIDAYDIRPLRDLGLDGTGETVVVTIVFAGLRQANLDAFTAKYGLPTITLDPVPRVDDPLSAAVGSGELEMDLEVIHAIAPGARLIVYDAIKHTNLISGLLAPAVDDNPNSIISQSWGFCETSESTAAIDGIAATFHKAADTGISVFTSSGDSGGYDCMSRNTDWGTPPSDDRIGVHMMASAPWVTGVGGTRLSLNADGSYYHETAWEQPSANEAGGGGLSSHFARPAWQVAPGVPTAGPDAKRAVPDVSADAESGMTIYSNGHWSTGGGTSQAAPIWAGMTAVINQYLKHQGVKPVGFMNPALYALASDPQPFPPFHDILVGSNLVYRAGPGYDMATGLGSPDAWNLARDLEAYQRAGAAP